MGTASRRERMIASAAQPVRIKATSLDQITWTKFQFKLLHEGKTLEDWILDQLRELNRTPLSKVQPYTQKLKRPRAPREHWIPVRVPAEEYRKARWRWTAMGVAMNDWFYDRIRQYCADVDLDKMEREIDQRGAMPITIRPRRKKKQQHEPAQKK